MYPRHVDPFRPKRSYLVFVSWQWCNGDISGGSM